MKKIPPPIPIGWKLRSGAISTDFGGSQKHDVSNQAGTEGVDRLAPTASQKTSEKVEAPNHAKKWNKEFSSLEKQIVALIAFMAPKDNIHKEIKKMADGNKITYSRLKKLDSGFLEMTTAPMKTNEQQTTPSRAKNTGVPGPYYEIISPMRRELIRSIIKWNVTCMLP